MCVWCGVLLHDELECLIDCLLKRTPQWRPTGIRVGVEPIGTLLTDYNSLAERYPCQFTRDEYWTNGTTTYLYQTPTMTASTNEASLAVPASTGPSPDSALRPRGRQTVRTASSSSSSGSHVVRDSLLAGSMAGIASTLCFHPFDVLRTKMQSVSLVSSSSSSSAARGAANAAAAAAASSGAGQRFCGCGGVGVGGGG